MNTLIVKKTIFLQIPRKKIKTKKLREKIYKEKALQKQNGNKIPSKQTLTKSRIGKYFDIL